MKKSLIALAVAGAMTAPIVAQADATLYGGVETRLKFVEDQDANLFVDKAEMGVKGSSDLENLDGVEATYQIEFRLNANGTGDQDALASTLGTSSTGEVQMRKANVGLHGGFGHVIVGRQKHLTEAAEGYTDIMMSASTGYLNSDRIGNAISYVTPKMAGFEAYAQLIADGGNSDTEEDVDAWAVGFNYALMGFDLSVGYTEVDGNYRDTTDPVANLIADPDFVDGDSELIVVGVGYSIGDLKLGATYEKEDVGATENELAALAATYSIGDAQLRALYSETYPDGGPNDYSSYAVQARYALGKKAGVAAEYAVFDPDNSSESSVDTVTFSYYVNF